MLALFSLSAIFPEFLSMAELLSSPETFKVGTMGPQGLDRLLRPLSLPRT